MPDSRFFTILEAPSSLEILAEICDGKVANATGNISDGDASQNAPLIYSVAPIDQAEEGQITFLTNAKYASKLKESKASACILSEKDARHAPKGIALILHTNPHLAYAKIAHYLHPDPSLASADVAADVIDASSLIHPSAVIDSSATIAASVKIAAGVTIGAHVTIGEASQIDAGAQIADGVVIGQRCRIGANAVISHTIMQDDVCIYPGAMVGQDGFGFATDMSTGTHLTVPQLGRVLLGRYVHVGSNTTIDRGAGPDTVIEDSVRIDNLVQIGHNVRIGQGSVIVSQVGISGSTVIGKFCVVGGQVGIAGHLNIGDKAHIAAQSGVMQDIAPGEAVGGSPALPIKQWHRQTIALRQLIKKPKKKSSAGGSKPVVSPLKITLLSLWDLLSLRAKR